MDALILPSSRPTVVVDPAAFGLVDPSGNFIGIGDQLTRARIAWAPGICGPQTVSLRYRPPHPPSESCWFGLDYSAIIPFGAGIESGTLAIFTNTATPTAADGDWTKGAVQVQGRALFAILSGGKSGTDYRLQWSATDTASNIWVRTVLCLCADTS